MPYYLDARVEDGVQVLHIFSQEGLQRVPPPSLQWKLRQGIKFMQLWRLVLFIVGVCFFVLLYFNLKYCKARINIYLLNHKNINR